MTLLLELLVTGVANGALYVLLALGFVLLFRATNVLNFAYGGMVLLGTLVVAEVAARAGFVVGALVGLAATATLGWLIDVLLLRRIRSADPLSLAILTLGLSIVIVTAARTLLGTRVLSLQSPWGVERLGVAGSSLPTTRVWALGLTVIVVVVLFVALQRTDWGLAMRTAAADQEVAAMMGVRLNRVAAAAWMIAGVFAVLAGIFSNVFPAPGLDGNADRIALRALPAAILGGLDSVHGAVVGGFVIGIAESLVSGYATSIPLLSSGFDQVVPYVILIVVLLIRPQGLFGSKAVSRV